ncbi:MAG: hypothetical protein L0220_19305, partial [Acidobacteria bacterium]|nr:hypothetical protein [Acidobacteriota bacterium]
VKFLVDYVPPPTEPEARAERRRFLLGFGKDGYFYKSAVLAFPKYTYVLRSIKYNHSDVLVAFRVLRRDSDASLVILWKMLKRSS